MNDAPTSSDEKLGQRPGFQKRLIAALRPALGTAGVTYLGMAMSFIATPMVARELGADGRGVLAAAFVSLQLVSWLGFLGIPRGIVLQRKSEGFTPTSSIGIVTLLGLISAVVCFATAGLVANGDERIEVGIRIASVLLVAIGIGQVGSEYVLAEGRMRVWNLARLSTVMLPAAANIVGFFGGWLTLEYAYLATLAGQVVATLVGCILAIPVFKNKRHGKLPWAFSFHYWSATAFDSLGGRADQLLLAALATPAALGTYAIGITFAAASGALTQAVNHSSYGRLVAAATAENGESDASVVRRDFSKRAWFAFGVSTVVGAAVVLVVEVFGSWLLGPGFEDIGVITMFLVLAQIVNDQWQLRVYADSATREGRYLTYASASAFVVLVLGVVALEVLDAFNSVSMAVLLIFTGAVRLGVRSVLKR